MKLVSVIMPTYNTPYEFLKGAVESITTQTYENLELIIIDDSSTINNDPEAIKKILGNDSRVRLLKSTRSKGVAGALNTGLMAAQGDYIIRMDSDDIAINNRIEHQVDYMEKHPEVSILAGYVRCFGASNKVIRSCVENSDIKTTLLFQADIAHPTVCIRKSVFDKYEYLYSENVQSEDYELWTRCAVNVNVNFATLPAVILDYRVHENQVTNKRITIMREQGKHIRVNYLKMLGVLLNEGEFEVFSDYVMLVKRKYSISQTVKVQNSIYYQLKKNRVFDEKRFGKTFRKICVKKACAHIVRNGDLSFKQMFLLLYNALRYFVD